MKTISINNDILIIFTVLTGAAILFVTNRVRNDLVASVVMNRLLKDIHR